MRRFLAVLLAVLAGLGPAGAQTQLFGPDKLLEAVTYNDYALTQRYLVGGVSPERADSYGKSALILASIAGYEDLVELLIEHKAKVNTQDRLGGSALGYAAQRGHVGVVEILIESGADIDLENRQGLTPLMLAAGAGRPEVVQLLLDRKADTGRHDYTGRTALNWAERNNRQPVARILRAAGATQ